MKIVRERIFLKKLIPPILLELVKKSGKYGFFGDYKSWHEAYKASTGYDHLEILEKVKNSLIKVKEGKVAYARDSVTFDEIQYPFPLISGLLKISCEYDGILSVLDFGGSLGTTYYQCRNFLSCLHKLEWSIVEQKHFVECGKMHFEDEILSFYYTITDCIKNKDPNVVILSGVVQCLEEPYSFLEELINYDFDYVIFDRTAFTIGDRDRLTIQRVSPDIYSASYPSWFLDFEKFMNIMLRKYTLIYDFDALDKANIPSIYKGFCFQKKRSISK
jgi:putative methyltransferase (TIGR04325 family)